MQQTGDSKYRKRFFGEICIRISKKKYLVNKGQLITQVKCWPSVVSKMSCLDRQIVNIVQMLTRRCKLRSIGNKVYSLTLTNRCSPDVTSSCLHDN